MTGFYPIRNTFPRKVTVEDNIELAKLENGKEDQSDEVLEHEQQLEVTQEEDKQQSDETQEPQQHQPLLKKSRKTMIKNFIRPIVTKMPIRVHSIVIIIYIFLLLILCCINYEPYSPNNVFHCSKGYRYVAYADRTGIIGTIQLPLVYLFSSRNNFIMYPTGLSYRAFQVFHKWTSRIVFVLFVLHGAFYLVYIDVKGDYIHRWGLTKFRAANAAFFSLVATVIWSFYRDKAYEWFKMTHKVLMIIFTIGIWYHCLTLGWIEYIALSFSIWAFEYILRIGRILVSGGTLKANCKVLYEASFDEENNELLHVPHSIRMEVNHSGWWKAYPGAYCWLYVLQKSRMG
ncbi:unnamed protein product [Ambrosiozyma monospora]|uniref:Unnamed protein product n=1 Tax=Ambrosiozyma monospora TaxID=43982 RepID=A0ACB5U6C4_AMBMO|nr:unnamed protein product [Ambrosiozyma monospora]